MPSPRITAEVEQRILDLFAETGNKTQVARRCGVSRNTVHDVLARAERDDRPAGLPAVDAAPVTAAPLSDLQQQIASLQAQIAQLQGHIEPEPEPAPEPPPFAVTPLPSAAPEVIHSPAFERWRNAPGRKDDDVYRVLVTPDAQVPYHDPVATRVVEMYAADHRFDEWIDLGDFMDLDFISRHNIGKHRQNANKLLKEHYALGREVLDRRLLILRKNNPDADYTQIEGNHDYRPEAVLDENPHLEGMIELAEGLGFAERGVRYVRFWRDGTVYMVGKAGYVHGKYTTRYHAAKMVEAYCISIFYGHTHDVQEIPKVIHGLDKVIAGQSLGCLCRRDLSYIGHNPKNWQLAFGDFFFFPSGHFTYYVPRIFNGKFIGPNGKVYSGWEK